MPTRNHIFAVDEYFHCYNRGTDKRIVFNDKQDYSYFIKSLSAYNSVKALGKLRLHEDHNNDQKIVELISYCLLPNHFHIVLKEQVEQGISKYMQRVVTGYTMYFNQKNKRSGGLFQGTFKSAHIQTDQDLRQVIAYVTNNNIVHNITDPALYRSKLNTESDIVRGLTSNNMSLANMREIVGIIKELRLLLD